MQDLLSKRCSLLVYVVCWNTNKLFEYSFQLRTFLFFWSSAWQENGVFIPTSGYYCSDCKICSLHCYSPFWPWGIAFFQFIHFFLLMLIVVGGLEKYTPMVPSWRKGVNYFHVDYLPGIDNFIVSSICVLNGNWKLREIRFFVVLPPLRLIDPFILFEVLVCR